MTSKYTPGLANWLRGGNRGLSSEFMVEVLEGLPLGFLTGKYYLYKYPYPHDASDFKRCVDLLRSVPIYRGRMQRLRKFSPIWKKLVDRWAEFEAELVKAENSREKRWDFYLIIRELEAQNENGV